MSYTQLWIHTDKRNYEEAKSKIEYILGIIKGKRQFLILNMDEAQTYRTLLFKDFYNYAGVTDSDVIRVE